jgi:U3 small nucleolar RNA-associated protein 22
MDAVMRFPLEDIQLNHGGGNSCKDAGVFDGISRTVVRVLERALGDRVKLIRVLTCGNGRVETTDNPSQVPIHNNNNKMFQIRTPDKNESCHSVQSPTGDKYLVLGFSLNPETLHRVVDRGPPAEDIEATREFLEFWGKEKAQLRRFKDGAIVHAVVWNDKPGGIENDKKHVVRLEGEDKYQGGIVERIVCHIMERHFMKSQNRKKHGASKSQHFALRDMLSLVDGVAFQTTNPDDKLLTNATSAFKSAMSAFVSLSDFLRQNSFPTITMPGSADAQTTRLGLPLAIDAVEPLSPTLRYSELFPPVPHPSLGGPRGSGKKVSGVAPPPILIQIRFGLSSKWPTDLKAMGAAKTAMLIQLANGIEKIKHGSDFDGRILVTPNYMDLGYKGYAWRIIVRADPELNMLRKLQQPSPQAVSLLQVRL